MMSFRAGLFLLRKHKAYESQLSWNQGDQVAEQGHNSYQSLRESDKYNDTQIRKLIVAPLATIRMSQI